MKYSIETILLLIVLFVCCELFGLFIVSNYYEKNLPYQLRPPQIPSSAIPPYFLFIILILTMILLLLKRLKMNFVIKIWFFSVLFICAAISLNVFLESTIALVISIILILIRYKYQNYFIHNFTEILCYGGVTALFVPMLNFNSIITLLILLSIYDIIAVYVTKHMIKLAEAQREMDIFSGLVIKFKDEYALLGGGDVAFPLLFASVALRDFGPLHALLSIYLSTIALVILVLIGEKKKYYPALPFLASGSFLGFFIAYLL
ncbi:MAG: presenilin family intramembrane aspartyl protease [Candidatus Parvarchaeota archaeon]|nr:presenilin family intramembrane aspartyl protease [Candidatus Jingweiarchaeum tengchongense]MCW1298312.1 presenilin family intramembrane aspartyl protease [Candidatus Jingweiarchaeum tengchongense]MCW1300403.1 presenilin family intramembrane aspartyl protease [Candidatus Jingweiarchaeum tengchongense]MCW1304752.1 presenilin family intramembrane aspartyl protease [Candidatus Jingweiarchaeum tengchongense]MCW1305342.1 presenilin family intramembrane aspartyl protease [Candidatus Jingweiarchaeu